MKIVQIGILVKDLERAVAEWESLTGIRGEITVTEAYDVTCATYLGKPCYGLLRQAVFDLENVQVELISPLGDEPSVWRDCLERDGEGLHHLAFLTEDVDGDIRELERRGVPLMQRGNWPAQPRNGTYAYMDAREGLKTIVELLRI